MQSMGCHWSQSLEEKEKLRESRRPNRKWTNIQLDSFWEADGTDNTIIITDMKKDTVGCSSWGFIANSTDHWHLLVAPHAACVESSGSSGVGHQSSSDQNSVFGWSCVQGRSYPPLFFLITRIRQGEEDRFLVLLFYKSETCNFSIWDTIFSKGEIGGQNSLRMPSWSNVKSREECTVIIKVRCEFPWWR